VYYAIKHCLRLRARSYSICRCWKCWKGSCWRCKTKQIESFISQRSRNLVAGFNLVCTWWTEGTRLTFILIYYSILLIFGMQKPCFL